MHHLIAELIGRYPSLTECAEEMNHAFSVLRDAYRENGKLLVCGNGGSASDAEHIVGELMKGFKSKRPIKDDILDEIKKIDPVDGPRLGCALQQPLEAIALGAHTGLNTAFVNDVEGGADFYFAQQVLGYGKKGDVFLGISTSGNSRNVFFAAETAKALGLKVIALTGEGGGKLAGIADVLIAPKERETFKVQELHLPIYHCLCLMLEEEFFARTDEKNEKTKS